jgi:hypothetical protein
MVKESLNSAPFHRKLLDSLAFISKIKNVFLLENLIVFVLIWFLVLPAKELKLIGMNDVENLLVPL